MFEKILSIIAWLIAGITISVIVYFIVNGFLGNEQDTIVDLYKRQENY